MISSVLPTSTNTTLAVDLHQPEVGDSEIQTTIPDGGDGNLLYQTNIPNCYIGVGTVVFEDSVNYPTDAYVTFGGNVVGGPDTDNDGLQNSIYQDLDLRDTTGTTPDDSQVTLGDTVVVYSYFLNNSGDTRDAICGPTSNIGPMQITSVRVEVLDDLGNVVEVINNWTYTDPPTIPSWLFWPDTNNPGLLQADPSNTGFPNPILPERHGFGLSFYDITIDSPARMSFRTTVTWACQNTPTGDTGCTNDPLGSPQPGRGSTYPEAPITDPLFVDVIGPLGIATVTQPSGPTLANPDQTINYVVELAGLGTTEANSIKSVTG